MKQEICCRWCGEPIDDPAGSAALEELKPEGSRVVYMHRECVFRNVVGSVGHILGSCPCKGGKDKDPPGMTKRQSARASYRLYFGKKGGRVH